MGRWSAHHRKIAILGWFAFVLISFTVGMFVIGAKQATDFSGPGESGRALTILDEGFKQPAGESVLIQSDSLKAGDPAFEAAIRAVLGTLAGQAAVTNVRSPLDPGNGGQISADGRSALVEFQIRGDADLAVEKIDPILPRRRGAGRASAVLHRHVRRRIDKEPEGRSWTTSRRPASLVPITLIILTSSLGPPSPRGSRCCSR
jgi:RND superfamily putative drug exporter